MASANDFTIILYSSSFECLVLVIHSFQTCFVTGTLVSCAAVCGGVGGK